MIKGVIFDVDGTLLDSMEIWEDVGVRYLNSIGIEAEPDLGTVLFTMSIQEGAAYVKEHYHLSQEPEEIVQGVLDIISNYYKNLCVSLNTLSIGSWKFATGRTTGPCTSGWIIRTCAGI